MPHAADYQRFRYGFGLVGRIQYFLAETDPFVMMAAMAIFLTLIVLTAMGKRLPLVAGLLATYVFNGSVWESLDAACGIGRMMIIGLICLQAPRIRTAPGAALALFGFSVLIGLPQTIFARDAFWTIQWCGVLVGTVIVGWTIGDTMRDRASVTRVLALYLITGVLWAGLGAMSVRELAAAEKGGARFSGIQESAGLFADTGGVVMPFFLWGAMQAGWRKWARVLCACGFGLTALVLFVIGQRSGMAGGVIASLPLLARANFSRMLAAGAALLTLGVFILIAVSINAKQTEYVWSRYTSSDLSKRDIIWRDGLKAVMMNPFVGHGFGTNRTEMREHIFDYRTVHNQYLSIWWDTGIVGLLAFGGSMLIGWWQLFSFVWRVKDPLLQDAGRLLLGELSSVMFCGFFSSGASSPTGLMTLTCLICLAGSRRLWVVANQLKSLQEWYARQAAVARYRWALAHGR